MKDACVRVADQKTRKFTRQKLLAKEEKTIIEETNSKGKTPNQTMSATLQKLKKEKFIEFLPHKKGCYRLK